MIQLKKAVIIKEPYFLRASTKLVRKKLINKSKKKEQRLKSLEAYLKNPNPNTLLVFIVIHSLPIRERKEYKLLTT